ncbi:MAG: hypothetical protein ABSE20_13490 [Acetobacteraceae bacterium]|jgi:hypothetical protein
MIHVTQAQGNLAWRDTVIERLKLTINTAIDPATENWRDTALLPADKQLFHLDLVDPGPDGGDNVAIYRFYVGEPHYDTVRAEVFKILRGEVRPLSGEFGSLAGILKQ